MIDPLTQQNLYLAGIAFLIAAASALNTWVSSKKAGKIQTSLDDHDGTLKEIKTATNGTNDLLQQQVKSLQDQIDSMKKGGTDVHT